MGEYFCEDCEEICQGKVVEHLHPDFKTIKNSIFVSECCEAPVLDEEGQEVSAIGMDDDAAYETVKQKEIDDALDKQIKEDVEKWQQDET